jgi:putative transposase
VVGALSDDVPENERHLTLALFRYRLIAEALEADRGERAGILRAVAADEHITPDGEPVHVTVRTLERWVSNFQKKKLAGLVRATRKDKGKARALTDAALERLITLRKEQPARSTTTLIDLVERAGEVAKGAFKRSTVDRHLDRRGGSRRMLHVLGTKRHVRLWFEHPMDFVVGDFHDGPYVRVASDEIRRAKIGAFIDHCSRYVPESRYGLAEDLMHVRRGLRALCVTWGLAEKLFVDNGPGYQAGRFLFGCAQLGINLIHSTPYVKESRGVIERFNRQIKEAFETEVRLLKEPPTLEQLNAMWRAWLEERHHRVVHSETGEPPLERWQRLLPQADIKHPDPALVDELLRLRARRRVDPKTSTVDICGVRFVVDTSLRKRRVDVLYDAADLSSVLIYFDGRRIQRATPQIPGEPPVKTPKPPTPPPPSIDYLALLRRDYERRRAQDVAAIRFRPVRDEGETLTLARLCERLRACCGRDLGDVERSDAAVALDALAPVEIPIAEAALKAAVATLGGGQHASQYLNALREHVLAARRKAQTP